MVTIRKITSTQRLCSHCEQRIEGTAWVLYKSNHEMTLVLHPDCAWKIGSHLDSHQELN